MCFHGCAVVEVCKANAWCIDVNGKHCREDSRKGCAFMEICVASDAGWATRPGLCDPVGSRPVGREPSLVEAGGQHIPRLSPRAGLCLHPWRSSEHTDAERVIRMIESTRS